MLDRSPLLLRWLALAALADWLLTRTLARSAIFMPKSQAVLAAYQGLTLAGQAASILAALLALAGVGWLAWQAYTWQERAAAAGLALLVLLSLVFLVLPTAGWPQLAFQALFLGAILWAARPGWRQTGAGKLKIAFLLTSIALAAGSLYQAIPALYTALRQPGPAPYTSWIFNLGELAVVMNGAALWWALRRKRAGGYLPYLLAGLPTLAFIALRMANPPMAGILAVWSLGLTLYLPWPLYALSLWLAGAAAISALRGGDSAGWAVLLFASAGYAPNLSHQVFFGLIGLFWLGNSTAAAALLDDLSQDTDRNLLGSFGVDLQSDRRAGPV